MSRIVWAADFSSLTRCLPLKVSMCPSQSIVFSNLWVWLQVSVLYEDEHMIAVNKPPDLLTAPKHRWMVRSSLLTMPTFVLPDVLSPRTVSMHAAHAP